MDIRPYAPISAIQRLHGNGEQGDPLPLMHTLPQDVQDQISRYVRKPDRYMSLASAVLKRLFIHRTAKIAWSDIQISKTPKPHSRPYWQPPKDWSGKGYQGLEFNVSHQAGLVVLVGCKTPSPPRDAVVNDQSEINVCTPAVINPDPNAVLEAESEIDHGEPEAVRIGIDVACTKEPPRTPDLSTQAKLEEWVDVFGEMFSMREQYDMKHAALPELDGTNELEQKARRFYTYWALKEAYIKMVGEGLLAPWLRELEFRDVPVPDRGNRKDDSWTLMPVEDTQQLKVLFKNRNISHTMQTTLEAFEETFLVATMTRGVKHQPVDGPRWERINMFDDVELCATGGCHCLDY